MSGQSTPAGWYPDPQNPAQQRYWDGASWSEAVQPAAGSYAPPTTQVGYGYTQGGAEPATFGSRAVALIVDALIVGAPLWVVFVAVSAISETLGIIAYLAGIVGAYYYYGKLEGGPEGQTIGKRTQGIRTVDAATLQPGIGMGRAIGRNLSRIISGFACYLGYLWMLWDPDKQTWHDKIVKTKVVKA